VKPGNILLSNDGRVKVADFGIARAVNAETVTQTATVFGTAAYIAPEQAQGQAVDRRTDVYALGCVLYEMLTGRQPFAGESAVALAYKHVSESPVPPSRLNPEISEELEAVTLQAMAKAPDDRYQTAKELHDDLQRARRGMSVTAPPPAEALGTTRVLERTGAAPPPTRRWDEEDYYYESDRGRGWAWVLLSLLLVGAFIVAGFLLADLFRREQPTMLPVPHVLEREIGDAQNVLVEAGFEPRLGEAVEHDRIPLNHVVATIPEPGTLADEGSVVTIIYSQGPPLVAVPGMSGLPEPEAHEALRAAGLSIGPRSTEPSEDIPEGHVIRSNPAEGQQVPAGGEVALVVSSGPPSYELPDVEGNTEAEARTILERFCGAPPCVRVESVREHHPAVEEGRVIRQDPTGGTEVRRDATVTIVVSLGPEAPPPTPTPTPTPAPTPSPPPPDEEEPPPDDEVDPQPTP
jgi:eukaryotic-like serine/threonine-protein kinase